MTAHHRLRLGLSVLAVAAAGSALGACGGNGANSSNSAPKASGAQPPPPFSLVSTGQQIPSITQPQRPLTIPATPAPPVQFGSTSTSTRPTTTPQPGNPAQTQASGKHGGHG